MSTATLRSRDPFMPKPAERNGPALGLALFAHLLLIAALAFGVNWQNSEPTTVAAELWSATPQAAAPREVEAPTPPPPPPPKAEAKRVEPVEKPAPTQPDPQIAIEKAKQLKRQQAEEEARAKEEAAKKKAKAAEKAEKLEAEKAEKLAKEKAEKLAKEKAEKADAAKQAAARDQYLKRMAGLAGATGGPTDTGSALRSSAPSASYAGRVAARVKPNIVFADAIDGNPRAVVEVKLAPDGTIIGKRLVQSSGVKAWDDAVLRAIERTEILPLDNGRVPPPFEIVFRPRD